MVNNIPFLPVFLSSFFILYLNLVLNDDMKVAITSPSLNVNINISGVSSLVNNIIEYNKSVSYIHLLVGRADNEKITFLKRASKIFGSYRNLFQLLTTNGFDLLHFNFVLYPKSTYRDMVTFMICKAFRKKIIVHFHGGTYLLKKPNDLFTLKLIKYLLNKADKIFVLSPVEKNALMQLYHVSNVEVLTNAVDTNLFKWGGDKKNPKKVKFLFLGRLHKTKGVQLMIQAFEKLRGKGYPVKLIICGDGPLRDYVETKAKEIDAIDYRGTVFGQQKIDVINECKVFVLPSLYGEGLPMALLEAMSCGLIPVVSTDGSMKYVIEHEVNGLMVQINDLDALIEAMTRAMKDDELTQRISKNARTTVINNYNWDNYLMELNNLYADVCEEKVLV
ncbi:MAG: putative glycosyltransferase [Mucilaginibacter sp.]|nr:putative glycosyltransferase [Mucilaginibacter sp.]